MVERVGHRLAVDHVVTYCEGIEADPILFDRPSDSVFQLRAGGRFAGPARRALWVVFGRLGSGFGSLAVRVPGISGTNIPACGGRWVRFRARPVRATAAREGEWTLTGPYGTNADMDVFDDGRGVDFKGYDFLGPPDIPSAISEFGSISCESWDPGDGNPRFDNAAVLVSPDGQFTMTDGSAAPPITLPTEWEQTVTVQGRFVSHTLATGTYTVARREGYTFSCSAGPMPFQMTLSVPSPEPGGSLSPVPPPPPLFYAALGDSFSSGEGADVTCPRPTGPE